MAFPNNPFGEEAAYTPYMGMQGYNQGQTTGYEYPDPTSLGPQPSLYNRNTSSGYIHQDTETSMDDEDEFWSLRSQDLNRLFAGLDPEETNGISGLSEGFLHDQRSAEHMQQTAWGNQYSAPTFPDANYPLQTTNHLASEEQFIYNSFPTGQPIYDSYLTREPIYNQYSTQQPVINPNSLAFEQTDPLLQPYAPGANAIQLEDDLHPNVMQLQPMTNLPGQGAVFPNQYQAILPRTNLEVGHQGRHHTEDITDNSATLERAKSYPKRGRRKTSGTRTRGEHLGSSSKSAPQDRTSARNRAPSTRKNAAPAHQSGLSRPSSAANTASAGNDNVLSKLGQRKLLLGERMGNDRREKAPIKREHGVLYGLVDGEWQKAGYHHDFREKLILMDAQQPGAPVFRIGMPNNYTSYSRFTRDWTADPASVRDSKGRQVHFLPTRPTDLPQDPNCGYLMCEGLVMLDHNDRVIKAYPGAPRTLSTDLPGWFIESLRRVFGMTYPDQLARMSAVYKLKRGRSRPLFGTTSLSNRTRAFRKKHKGLGMVPWNDREKGKAAK